MEYEIIPCKHETGFLVWTPDDTGGVIGHGKTEREALEDAVRNMEACCAEIKRTEHERMG